MPRRWDGREFPEPPPRVEVVYRSEALVVTRVGGRPRDAAEGRHADVVCYIANATPARIVHLLREAADRLERTLPRGDS